jgi:hypothetical protein
MDVIALVFGFLLGLYAMQRSPGSWPDFRLAWPPPEGGEPATHKKET